MNMNITKLHFSEVRNIVEKNSLMEEKYDTCLIGFTSDGEEKYGIYCEEKLLLVLYMEIIIEYRADPNKNYLDHEENLFQARQRLDDLNDNLLQAFWFGLPYSIICEDYEYLNNRSPYQTINTCDRFEFEPTNYDYLYRNCGEI